MAPGLSYLIVVGLESAGLRDAGALGSVVMTAPDTRIVLRGAHAGEAEDLIVDHPGQPGDYVHADGTVWTWRERWRIVDGVREGVRRVGGVHLRMYDLVAPGTDSGRPDAASSR